MARRERRPYSLSNVLLIGAAMIGIPGHAEATQTFSVT